MDARSHADLRRAAAAPPRLGDGGAWRAGGAAGWPRARRAARAARLAAALSGAAAAARLHRPGLAARRGAQPRAAPSGPAGGSASAISSPASTGSPTRCSSIRRDFGWMIPFALSALARGLGAVPGAATWLATLAARARRRARPGPRRVWVRARMAARLGPHRLSLEPDRLRAGPSPTSRCSSPRGSASGVSAWSPWSAAALPAVLADSRRPARAARLARGRGAARSAWRCCSGSARCVCPAAGRRRPCPTSCCASSRPNIAADAQVRNADQMRSQSRAPSSASRAAPGFARVTDVIWPETAVPFAIERDPALRAWRWPRRAAGRAAGHRRVRVGRATDRPIQLLEQLAVVDGDGESSAPTTSSIWCRSANMCRSVCASFSVLSKITPGAADFSAGPRPRTLAVPGLPPVGPLICYEVDLPRRGGRRPTAARHWLLNVTNDAGSAISSAPTSISSAPGCARSRRACRWCAPPTPASRRSSIPMAGCWRRSALGSAASSTRRCPSPWNRNASMHAIGDWTLCLLALVALLCPSMGIDKRI